MTTRRDPPWPLPRLRLAGLVAEIRAADLAFRAEEAAELFTRLQVDVTGPQLEQLVERTEGWAAGLRLVAVHLKAVPDLPAAVEVFSGEDHSVADYLLTEVLDRQAPEQVAILETISVVDLVCADLADALTGGHDGARVLADLAAAHLFVQAVGQPGRWYRLHRLISDILRARPVPRRRRRDLHRRAAEWFRSNAMPLEAIRSAVAGELWPWPPTWPAPTPSRSSRPVAAGHSSRPWRGSTARCSAGNRSWRARSPSPGSRGDQTPRRRR